MGDIDLYHFTIRVAGITVRINTLYPKAIFLCFDYLYEGTPDFEITIKKQDLIDEQTIAFQNGNRQAKWGHLETLAIHRKILDRAIAYDAFMIHGAAIAVDDVAYIFCGKSGIGKTTHTQKWLAQTLNTFVINGDKPIIRLIDSTFFVSGTPWSGKERLNTNTMVPLKAIICMERAKDNHLEEISFPQAYLYFIQQIYIPDDPEKAKRMLDLLSQLYGKVRFYKFYFNNFKDDCFEVAYNALVKENQ